MTRTREHLPSLDGLRGVAALAVLLGHLGLTEGSALATWSVSMGVDVFFVLSGFLITRILLHNRERGVPLRSFLWRRALRIFPVYYLVVLASVLIWDVGWNALYALTYTFNFVRYDKLPVALGPTWSLCVEEHFYLVWPVLVTFVPAKWSRGMAVRLLIAAALGTYLFERFAPVWGAGASVEAWLYRMTPFRACGLLAGSVLAYDEARWRGTATSAWAGAALAAGGVAVMTFGLPIAHAHGTGQMVARVLAATGMLLLALSALRPVFALGPLRWVGWISYGLYLYHGPVYELLVGYGRAAMLGGTFAAATVSYYGFERPVLRWGKSRDASAATPDGPACSATLRPDGS